MYKRTLCTYHRCAHIVKKDGDIDVKPGLAVTPAQMHDMMLKGIPISTSAFGLVFDDGVPNPSGLLLENVRGIDRSDLWQQQQSIKKKMYKAHVDDVAKHGFETKSE